MFGSASLPIHERRCRKRPVTLSITAPSSPEPVSRTPASRTPASPSSRPLPILSAAPGMPPSPTAPMGDLQPCQHCGRTFDPSRLAVHERVCIAARGASTRSPTASKAAGRIARSRALSYRAPSRWRQQHEELMSIVAGQRGTGTTQHPRIGPARRPATSLGASMRALHRYETLTSQQPYASISPTKSSMAAGAGSGVASRGSSAGRSPMRRPTAAQRHARDWYERQSGAGAAAASTLLPASPPRQLMQLALSRGLPSSPATGEVKSRSAIATLSSSTWHKGSGGGHSVHPSMSDMPAGFSQKRFGHVALPRV